MAKIKELEEIRTLIGSELGKDDLLGNYLQTNVGQYIDVVRMLMHRGTKQFWEHSSKLYGSPKDSFAGDTNQIRDLGQLLYGILGNIDDASLGVSYPDTLEAQDVVDELNKRFIHFFKDDQVHAKMSDGIIADAAAGSNFVKIREGSRFSTRDVDILEVHEGWVHVGTTQNGEAQHVCTFLAKGPPRCAATQEGLAVIMEIFTFRTYPKRARSINDRILGIDKAEEGANYLDLIEFYRTEGYDEGDCMTNAKRVMRGGMVEGGAPFTKDLSYCKGFIENYNFLRTAMRAGRPELIPFLFAGKIHVEDVPLIYRLHLEGIIDAPKYLPDLFRDLNGVAVWMSYSSFFNQVNLKKIQERYDKLFETYL